MCSSALGVALAWFVGQSLVFILLAFVLGVITGRLWKAAEKPVVHHVTGFEAEPAPDTDISGKVRPEGTASPATRPSPRPRAPR